MTAFDWILIAPAIYGMIRGLRRGLMYELATAAGLVAGVLLARLFGPLFARVLMTLTTMPAGLAGSLSYLIIFLLIMWGMKFIARLAKRMLTKLSLGWANKLGGALFGALKYLLIVSLVLNVFGYVDDQIHILSQDTRHDSKLYIPIRSLSGKALNFIQGDAPKDGQDGAPMPEGGKP